MEMGIGNGQGLECDWGNFSTRSYRLMCQGTLTLKPMLKVFFFLNMPPLCV